MRTMLFCALCAAVLLSMLPPLAAKAGVIPLPRQMTSMPGIYRLSRSVVIVASNADERNVASFLKTFLAHHDVTATVESEQVDQAAIRLSAQAHDPSLGPEGYRLLVGTGGVSIAANGGPGLFYGLQTLEQLAIVDASGDLVVPGTRVVDWPQYEWRGIHLDVSRHFFPVPVVERYIDLAARYKLNTFHWHSPTIRAGGSRSTSIRVLRRSADAATARKWAAKARRSSMTGDTAATTRKRRSATSWRTRARDT